MKGFLKVLIIPFLLVVLCVANAHAFPIAVNDKLIITAGTYRIGSGGEFLLTEENDAYAYVSFCVEKKEYISLGSTYKVNDVSDTAFNGGIGPIGDVISDASQWVANLWRSNYELLGFTEKTAANAQLVQQAIWHFEGEDDYSGNGIVSNLESDVTFFVGGEWLSTSWLNDSVKVVNLVSSDGTLKQSQLVAVPEPATMLLLGTGLIGLAGVSRKKFKK